MYLLTPSCVCMLSRHSRMGKVSAPSDTQQFPLLSLPRGTTWPKCPMTGTDHESISIISLVGLWWVWETVRQNKTCVWVEFSRMLLAQLLLLKANIVPQTWKGCFSYYSFHTGWNGLAKHPHKLLLPIESHADISSSATCMGKWCGEVSKLGLTNSWRCSPEAQQWTIGIPQPFLHNTEGSAIKTCHLFIDQDISVHF